MATKELSRKKKTQQEYYLKNKERILAESNRYYANNKEKRLIYAKKYQLENKDYYKNYKKIWALENKEKIKNYYQRDKTKAKVRNQKRYRLHKKEMIAKVTEYRRNRVKVDPNFKLGLTLRSKLYDLLKSTLNPKMSEKILFKKRTVFVELIGCTLMELKDYMERNFKEGMNWDNWSYYGWHIDHKIPVSRFDITDLEERKKAFHFTNLQPLWAHENRKKFTS